MSLFSGKRPQLKTPEQIALMREAGLVVARTLEMLRDAVAPGVTTGELDALAEERIISSGATPSFKGYLGFPASICTSVNDEVVHGIPGDRKLAEGDLISIDCGAIVDGWHGDAAITVGVGEVAPELVELTRVCEEALWRGLAAAVAGGKLGDVSAAVQGLVEAASAPTGAVPGGAGVDAGSNMGANVGPIAGSGGSATRGRRRRAGYGIVRDYVGHGIGTEMHQDPNVPNVGKAGRGLRLTSGLAIAVEPMLTMGDPRTAVLEDDWTVVTMDGSYAAHAEHTVALTTEGPWVLTALDGGVAKLAQLGVPCGAR